MNTLYKNLAGIKAGSVIAGKWNGKRYTIIRSLGSGENGIVYLVQSQQRQYALKLSPASTDLSYEIQVIQRLNETRGQSLGFSVFDIDDFFYLGESYAFYVMPYFRGISIEKYLYGKGEQDYLIIFRKLLELLEIVHSEGIIIGDLKPEHIIIDPNSMKISIIDFGGATPLSEGIRQYTEIYDRGGWKVGDRKADQHYDLFSLALIFIQMGIGKNKLIKIFKQTASIAELYGIIRRISILTAVNEALKGILFRKILTTKEAANQLKLSATLSRPQKDSKKWIEWLFNSSLIIFVLVFVYFISSW